MLFHVWLCSLNIVLWELAILLLWYCSLSIFVVYNIPLYEYITVNFSFYDWLGSFLLCILHLRPVGWWDSPDSWRQRSIKPKIQTTCPREATSFVPITVHAAWPPLPCGLLQNRHLARFLRKCRHTQHIVMLW